MRALLRDREEENTFGIYNPKLKHFLRLGSFHPKE